MTLDKETSPYPAPTMDVKDDIEQLESSVDAPMASENEQGRPQIWSYFAAAGLMLGWIAEQQYFLGVGLLQTTINSDLGPKLQHQWIFLPYLFCVAGLSPVTGAFSDRLGKRWIVIGGNLLAIVGAIVGATAHSVNVTIVGATISGIGCTGQHLAFAGISELFPRKHRAFAQGALVLAALPFTACGVLIAGAMADESTWRWAYYLNIILSGLAFFTTLFFYYPPLPAGKVQFIKTLDWIQPILLTVGLFTSAIAVGWAAFRTYSWRNAAILVPISVGMIISGCYVLRAILYKGPTPLVPMMVLNKEFIFLCTTQYFISFLSVQASFAWVVEVQSVYTLDLIKVGVYALPGGIGTEVGAVIAALGLQKFGPTHYQLAVACVFLTLFIALLGTLTAGNIRPAMAYLSLAGIANGFVQILTITMVQLTSSDQYLGSTTGGLLLGRYAGFAVGILMSQTIVDSRVITTLGPHLSRTLVPLGLPETSVEPLVAAINAVEAGASELGLLEVPGITVAALLEMEVVLHEVYAAAFRISWYPFIAVGLIAAALAFFTPDVRSRMDNSLAFSHGRPWFLRRGARKSG